SVEKQKRKITLNPVVLLAHAKANWAIAFPKVSTLEEKHEIHRVIIIKSPLNTPHQQRFPIHTVMNNQAPQRRPILQYIQLQLKTPKSLYPPYPPSRCILPISNR